MNIFSIFGDFYASGTQDTEVTKSLLYFSSSSVPSCTEVVSQDSVTAPAIEESTSRCVYQKQPLLYSCTGHDPNYRRFCPCRHYREGQIALCRSCFWKFKKKWDKKLRSSALQSMISGPPAWDWLADLNCWKMFRKSGANKVISRKIEGTWNFSSTTQVVTVVKQLPCFRTVLKWLPK